MQYSWYNKLKKRGELMKKIILAILCVLMFGCSNKISESTSDVEKSEVTKEETENQWCFSISYGVGNHSLKYELEQYFKYVPSTISIEITGDKKEIGFIYEYCINDMSDEEWLNFKKDLKKDRSGNFYLYYGELKKISRENISEFGVYESKGSFIPPWKEQERQVSDEVDFYVILDHEKLYITFSEEFAKSVQTLEDENYVSINFSSLYR